MVVKASTINSEDSHQTRELILKFINISPSEEESVKLKLERMLKTVVPEVSP